MLRCKSLKIAEIEINGVKLSNTFEILQYIGKQEERIAELEAQIAKQKSIGRTAYIKGVRTMANALKSYDRTDGAWTDYFEHTVDKVLKKLLKE